MKRRTRVAVAGLFVILSAMAGIATFASIYDGAPDDAHSSPWFWAVVVLLTVGYVLVFGAWILPFRRVVGEFIEGSMGFFIVLGSGLAHGLTMFAGWMSRILSRLSR